MTDDEMRPEYDFSGAVRGVYYHWYWKGPYKKIIKGDLVRMVPDKGEVMTDEKSATHDDLAEEVRQWDSGEIKPTDPGWEESLEAAGFSEEFALSCHRAVVGTVCGKCGKEIKEGHLCKIYDVEPEEYGGLQRVSVCPHCAYTDLQEVKNKEKCAVRLLQAIGKNHGLLPCDIHRLSTGPSIAETFRWAARELGVESIRQEADIVIMRRTDGSEESWSMQELIVIWNDAVKAKAPRLGMDKIIRTIGECLCSFMNEGEQVSLGMMPQAFDLATKRLAKDGVTSTYQHADMIGVEFEDGTREEYSQRQIIMKADFSKRGCDA